MTHPVFVPRPRRSLIVPIDGPVGRTWLLREHFWAYCWTVATQPRGEA